MFPFEYSEFFQNADFEEHQQTTASPISRSRRLKVFCQVSLNLTAESRLSLKENGLRDRCFPENSTKLFRTATPKSTFQEGASEKMVVGIVT